MDQENVEENFTTLANFRNATKGLRDDTLLYIEVDDMHVGLKSVYLNLPKTEGHRSYIVLKTY